MLIIKALLPEAMRFSHTLLLYGYLFIFSALGLFRYTLAYLKLRGFYLNSTHHASNLLLFVTMILT